MLQALRTRQGAVQGSEAGRRTSTAESNCWLLGGEPGDIAIADESVTLTYGELAARAQSRSLEWGGRQLVMLHLGADVESVISYLAVLIGGHVGLIVGANKDDSLDTIGSAYRPSVIASPDGWSWAGVQAPLMHPELQLLMSTSGSTGSPKLVRLSRRNLQVNTADIVAALGLRSTDRTITTLPVSYCYGLSVLNSHLLAGGSIHLSELSIADSCFWRDVERIQPTTLAAVPYTLQLLESADWASRKLESLRTITVAGGAVDTQGQQRWRAQTRAAGIDFITMYGQTEATARMAVLNAGEYAPGRTGKAVGSGSFSIDESVDDRPGVGEVVYAGPNVMMGYARTIADLNEPADTTLLRTGDLGSLIDGYLEVCGRKDDFLKVFGLRIDIAAVERELRSQGWDAVLVNVGDDFGVLVQGTAAHSELPDLISDLTGLPVAVMTIKTCTTLPRRPSGKLDRAQARATLGLGDHPGSERPSAQDCPGGAPSRPSSQQDRAAAIQQVYRDVLRLPKLPAASDSFVSLRGDSLSYVAASAQLERAGIEVGVGWQRQPISELAAVARTRGSEQSRSWFSRAFAPVESTVVIRAIAILLIVGSHIDVIEIVGGAHVLLMVAGLNLALFQLAAPSRRDFVTNTLRSLSRLLVPILIWLVPVWLIASEYGASVLLVNNLFGSPTDSPEWRYWFLEAVLICMAMTVAIIAIPAVWASWQRRPEYVGLALLGLGLVWLALVDRPADGPGEIFSPAVTAWMFALGLTIGAFRTKNVRWQAMLFVGVLAVTVGFFDHNVRAALFILGVATLLWVPRIHLPRAITPAVAALAAASLGIYLTHFQVYPVFGSWGWVGFAASIAFGLVFWLIVTRVTNMSIALLPSRDRVTLTGTSQVADLRSSEPNQWRTQWHSRARSDYLQY